MTHMTRAQLELHWAEQLLHKTNNDIKTKISYLDRLFAGEGTPKELAAFEAQRADAEHMYSFLTKVLSERASR